MTHELDDQIAEKVMRWTPSLGGEIWCNDGEMLCGKDEFRPTRDRDDFALVLAELGRRGDDVAEKYVVELSRILDPEALVDHDYYWSRYVPLDAWDLLTAPLDTCCRAALKAVEGQSCPTP